MALENIKLIKKAEDETNDKIKSAQLQAKEIVRNADISAANLYKDLIQKAKESCNGIMAAADAEAKNEAKPVFEQGRMEVQKIAGMEDSKINDAVSIVIGRIVRNNGNS
ncbi:MAG: ATPase [Eubacteriaceae bacterium]|nr:ATPase [Eubacteriaceae bacterium]